MSKKPPRTHFEQAKRKAVADPVRAERIAGFEAANERAIALEALRRRHEVTQAALAAVLGISQRRVSTIERQPDAQVSTLRAFVQALGYDELELVAVRGDERVPFRLGTSDPD